MKSRVNNQTIEKVVNEITSVLYVFDPEVLKVHGVPKDEYRPEAELIVEYLLSLGTLQIEVIEKITAEVFTDMFGREFDKSLIAKVAKEIHRVFKKLGIDFQGTSESKPGNYQRVRSIKLIKTCILNQLFMNALNKDTEEDIDVNTVDKIAEVVYTEIEKNGFKPKNTVKVLDSSIKTNFKTKCSKKELSELALKIQDLNIWV